MIVHIINPAILNEIQRYKNIMETNIKQYVNYLLQQKSFEFFLTPNYRLFTLIAENIRLNLNFFSTVIIEWDIFNFLGPRRNIRNSIESYYDLFNLSTDEEYFDLMKYNSEYVQCPDEVVIRLKKSKYNIYVYNKNNTAKKKHLTMADKSNIALLNGMDEATVQWYRKISKESNQFIHPDIFMPVEPYNEKMDSARGLMVTDCQLLNDAFQLLLQFIVKNIQCNIQPAPNDIAAVKNIILNYPIFTSTNV